MRIPMQADGTPEVAESPAASPMSVDGAASSAVARTDPAPSPAASEPEVVTRLIRLFVLLAVAAGVGLVLLWGMPLLRAGWEAAGSPRTRVAVMTILGITLSGIGVWGVFARTAFESHLAVSPLSLAAGVLLLSAAARLQRRRQGYTRRESVAIAEWIMVFVLIGLSLFWVAYD